MKRSNDNFQRGIGVDVSHREQICKGRGSSSVVTRASSFTSTAIKDNPSPVVCVSPLFETLTVSRRAARTTGRSLTAAILMAASTVCAFLPASRQREVVPLPPIFRIIVQGRPVVQVPQGRVQVGCRTPQGSRCATISD